MSDPDPVRVELAEGVAVVHLDDGKANAISHALIDAVHDALDRATESAHAVAIVGRPGRFSAGFDLSVMGAGDKPMQDLVLAGAELLCRLYAHPQPVVVGCTGHALAAGALVLLTGDVRVGAAGDFRIGLNEATIGMALPEFGVELARDRLTPAALTASTALGQVHDPEGAVAAGFLDRLVGPDEVVDEAVAEAARLSSLRTGAVGGTKQRLRGPTIRRIRATLLDDVGGLSGPRP
jgi:enoyl-CoA hydratase